MQNVLTDTRRNLRNDLIFYLACFVFLYLHLFYWPAIPIFNEADHVNLLNDAKRITEGEVIYRDFFEFVFPGAPALYALLMGVIGPKFWIVNAVIGIHGMLAAILGVQISRRVIADSAIAYLPSAIFIFFGFRWLGGDGEHRMLSPLFAYAAVLVLLRGRTFARLAAAGAACGFTSFFTQQRGFVTAAAIGIFLFVEFGISKRDWGGMIKRSAVLLGTFLAVLVVLVLPFVIAAGPATFFDCTFVFLRSYVQEGEFNNLNTYITTFTKTSALGIPIMMATLFYTLLIPGVYVIVFIVGFIRWRRSEGFEMAGIMLVSLVGLFLALGNSGPNVSRFYQVALLGVIALVWLIAQARVATPARARLAVAALALIGILLGIRLQLAPDSEVIQTESGRLVFLSPVLTERYKWLIAHAKPGDLVYETYNSYVNFPLGFRNPSRISILLNSGYSPPHHVAWVIEDLKRENPRYIIWDGAWTNDVTQRPEGERLEPFYRYMAGHYHRVASFSVYEGREREIWERNGR